MEASAASLLLIAVLGAATIRVPDDHATIQTAIDAAQAGDTIQVAPGDYPEQIVLKEGIILHGAGAEATHITGVGVNAVVTGASFSEISGFTISGSLDDDIDGIRCVDIEGFTITRNVIANNTWSGIDSTGSAIVVSNNLIVGNRVAGIFLSGESSSDVVVVHNTIVGNHNEAGINIWHGASARLVNNIIVENTGYGGVYCLDGGRATFVSNNVWGNTCWMPPCSDYVGCEAGETDVSVDPLFRDSSGGDYRLRLESPCIDAGTAEDAPDTDLDGGERPCAAGVDLGCYEACGPLPFRRGDPNEDENADLSDAVFVLNYLFVGGPVPGCEDSADADDSGTLDITDAVYLLNYLFLGGPEPPPPGPLTPGFDGTPTDPFPCGDPPTSGLRGVALDLSTIPSSLSLAEAAEGVTLRYTVTIAEDIRGVSSRPLDAGRCDMAGPSGLRLFERISGNGQNYCLCDVGHCIGQVEPVDLARGQYAEVLEWTGRNWFGPSDTVQPMGPPFPPGLYTLEVQASGTYQGSQGVETSFEIAATTEIELVE